MENLDIKQKYAILHLVYTLLLSSDCSEKDNKVISLVLQTLNIDKSFGGLIHGENIPWSDGLLTVLNSNIERSFSTVSELTDDIKQEVKKLLMSVAKNDNMWARMPVATNILNKINIVY